MVAVASASIFHYIFESFNNEYHGNKIIFQIPSFDQHTEFRALEHFLKLFPCGTMLATFLRFASSKLTELLLFLLLNFILLTAWNAFQNKFNNVTVLYQMRIQLK